jgi:hypothetical protein
VDPTSDRVRAPYGGATLGAWQCTDRAGLTVDCNAYPGTDLTVLFGAAPISAQQRNVADNKPVGDGSAAV